jgi:cell division protein FtsZ
MTEVDEAAKIISSAADPDANIIFGATINESLHDQIRITVVATGFDQTKQRLQQFVIQQPTPPIKQQPIAQDDPQNNVPPAQQAKDDKKPEDDWDIPAFLRQRN